MSKFKIGDLVYLAGTPIPVVTVTDLIQSRHQVEVAWWNNGQFSRDTFHEDALVIKQTIAAIVPVQAPVVEDSPPEVDEPQSEVAVCTPIEIEIEVEAFKNRLRAALDMDKSITDQTKELGSVLSMYMLNDGNVVNLHLWDAGYDILVYGDLSQRAMFFAVMQSLRHDKWESFGDLNSDGKDRRSMPAKYRTLELETLAGMWESAPDVSKIFNGGSSMPNGMSRGDAYLSQPSEFSTAQGKDFNWPMNYAPATDKAGAQELVRSGKYVWAYVTPASGIADKSKHGLCLIPNTTPANSKYPRMSVIPEAGNVFQEETVVSRVDNPAIEGWGNNVKTGDALLEELFGKANAKGEKLDDDLSAIWRHPDDTDLDDLDTVVAKLKRHMKAVDNHLESPPAKKPGRGIRKKK